MKKNTNLDLMDLGLLEIQSLDDAVLNSIVGGCTNTCSCPSCSVLPGGCSTAGCSAGNESENRV